MFNEWLEKGVRWLSDEQSEEVQFLKGLVLVLGLLIIYYIYFYE